MKKKKYYVCPHIYPWKDNIQVDVASGTFLFSEDLEWKGRSCGFMEVYDDLQEYSRDHPDVEPLVFQLKEYEDV